MLNFNYSYPPPEDFATIEHVMPRSEGGMGHLPNLKLSHWACNNLRGNASFEDFIVSCRTKKPLEVLAMRRKQKQERRLENRRRSQAAKRAKKRKSVEECDHETCWRSACVCWCHVEYPPLERQ